MTSRHSIVPAASRLRQRDFRISFMLAISALAALMLGSAEVRAQSPTPFVYAEGHVNAFGQAGCGLVPGANGGIGFSSTGPFSVSATESSGQSGGPSPLTSACNGNWGGQASASSSFGKLSAYASTALPYRNAGALAYFSDVLTYESTTGQTGIGSAGITLSVDGNVTIAAVDANLTHNAAAIGVTGRQTDFTLPRGFDNTFINDVTTFPITPGIDGVSKTIDGILTFTWGVPFQLYISLGASSGDFTDTGEVTSSIVDASHTLKVTHLEVPVGAKLIAASGFDYAAAVVPEPEEWVMMLAGLGILGAAQRRRRST